MTMADSMTPKELFDENIRLASIVAGRYKFPDEDFDDLHSDTLLGLWQAACRWDESRGVPFAAYAQTRMHGQIIDGRIKRDPRPQGHIGTHSRLISLDKPVGERTLKEVIEVKHSNADIESLIEDIFHEQTIAAIKKESLNLDSRNQHIVKELLKGRTARSIADDFNVTESAISHRVRDCIRKIRKQLMNTGFIEVN